MVIALFRPPGSDSTGTGDVVRLPARPAGEPLETLGTGPLSLGGARGPYVMPGGSRAGDSDGVADRGPGAPDARI